MASNHKLTSAIKGRTIASTSHSADGKMLIGFTDGSTMTIKTAGNSNCGVTGQTVKAVRQQDTTLSLDFENGSSLDITTAEPTSSVMLRDKNHVLEYAD